MDRDQLVVCDAVWAKIALLLPGKATDPGATGKDNRLFLEAVLWRVRTGSPWHDLPSGFRRWNSVFQWFRRWARAGATAKALVERPSPGLSQISCHGGGTPSKPGAAAAQPGRGPPPMRCEPRVRMRPPAF